MYIIYIYICIYIHGFGFTNALYICRILIWAALRDTNAKAADVDCNFGAICGKCAHHGKHCKLMLRFVGKDTAEIFDDLYKWVSHGRSSSSTQHDDAIRATKIKHGVKVKFWRYASALSTRLCFGIHMNLFDVLHKRCDLMHGSPVYHWDMFRKRSSFVAASTYNCGVFACYYYYYYYYYYY